VRQRVQPYSSDALGIQRSNRSKSLGKSRPNSALLHHRHSKILISLASRSPDFRKDTAVKSKVSKIHSANVIGSYASIQIIMRLDKEIQFVWLQTVNKPEYHLALGQGNPSKFPQ
jgi:hypothetical protein